MSDTPNSNVPLSPAELPRTSRGPVAPAPSRVSQAGAELVKAKTDAADASARQTDDDNRRIAALRKQHEDLNVKVADATRYGAQPPEVVALRKQKADVARQINDLEVAQRRRVKDEMRSGVPVGGPVAQ